MPASASASAIATWTWYGLRRAARDSCTPCLSAGDRWCRDQICVLVRQRMVQSSWRSTSTMSMSARATHETAPLAAQRAVKSARSTISWRCRLTFATSSTSASPSRHKIDRSFVARVGQRVNDTAIIRSILSRGAELELFVVAEGIETRAQHDELKP